MKELRNKWDQEFGIESLEKAKYYFTPAEAEFLETKEEMKKAEERGDFKYARQLADLIECMNEYAREIAEAESLEMLAIALNSYTDRLGNGTQYYVYEW